MRRPGSLAFSIDDDEIRSILAGNSFKVGSTNDSSRRNGQHHVITNRYSGENRDYRLFPCVSIITVISPAPIQPEENHPTRNFNDSLSAEISHHLLLEKLETFLQLTQEQGEEIERLRQRISSLTSKMSGLEQGLSNRKP